MIGIIVVDEFIRRVLDRKLDVLTRDWSIDGEFVCEEDDEFINIKFYVALW